MKRFALLSIVFFVSNVIFPSSAIGGLAELKAITGDMPYMGVGNHETAGEVYMSRSSGGFIPYSNYLYNQPYYQQFDRYQQLNSPYGITGGTQLNSPPMGVPGPGTGRFYQGIGNAFVNRQK
uniref:Secreted protein n=1 Tax=Steinernema glaseri TaxID=37863 RepID=A0A1I7ZNW9_9BILA